MLRSFVVILSLTLALLAIGAGYGRLRYGSASAVLASLQGQAIHIDERAKSISGVHAGSQIIVNYRLTNLLKRPIKIIGSTSSCTCTMIQNLPMTLDSFETKDVSAQITISEQNTIFSGSVRLFTDEPSSPEIALSYTVRATAPLASEARRNQ